MNDDVVVVAGRFQAVFDVQAVRGAVQQLWSGAPAPPVGRARSDTSSWSRQRLVARAGAAVKTIEAGRGKKQGLHGLACRAEGRRGNVRWREAAPAAFSWAGYAGRRIGRPRHWGRRRLRLRRDGLCRWKSRLVPTGGAAGLGLGRGPKL